MESTEFLMEDSYNAIVGVLKGFDPCTSAREQAVIAVLFLLLEELTKPSVQPQSIRTHWAKRAYVLADGLASGGANGRSHP